MWTQTLVDLTAIVALAILTVLFLFLESRALLAWQGGWRIAAIAPAMVIGWITLGIVVNPAAHSLWPIELILWLIPAILILLIGRALVRGAERLHTI